MKVGDLVRVKRDYQNTEAAGMLALIVKRSGNSVVVQALGNLDKPHYEHRWWFNPEHLEVI
jgi:hypothetical protein